MIHHQISHNKEVCDMADKEKFFIPIEGKLIEVEENVYIAYYKMGRRERYLEERDQANGVLSYDALDHDGIESTQYVCTYCWFSVLYCWGVFPVTSRKDSEKWLEDAKCRLSAICETGIPELTSIILDRSIRTYFI